MGDRRCRANERQIARPNPFEAPVITAKIAISCGGRCVGLNEMRNGNWMIVDDYYDCWCY